VTSVRPYELADRTRWDAYVEQHPDSSFGQLRAWTDLMWATHHCRPWQWISERHGRICGVLPLFEKRGWSRQLFSVPGGLLADDDEAATALLGATRKLMARRVVQSVELRDQRYRWPDLATNREHVTLELELAPDIEAQWAELGTKLRTKIRKGQKSGFTARFGHENVADFHRVLLANMRDLGTPIRGLDYYRRVLEAFGEAAEVLVIDHAGRPAGGMLLLVLREAAVNPWASSLRSLFTLRPNEVLYWTALQWAIRRGLKRFDMGRSQWGSGTFEFKEQWGATPVPLYYQYLLGRPGSVPTLEEQVSSYRLAARLWKRLPLPAARALGEPVKRRLFPEVV
jgi:FemAB-related protein (PEP-CTERM system-associated)